MFDRSHELLIVFVEKSVLGVQEEAMLVCKIILGRTIDNTSQVSVFQK